MGEKTKPFCWDKPFATERLNYLLSTGAKAHVAIIPEDQRAGFPTPWKDGDPRRPVTLGSLS